MAQTPLHWLKQALPALSSAQSLARLRAICTHALATHYQTDRLALFGLSEDAQSLVPLQHKGMEGAVLAPLAWQAGHPMCRAFGDEAGLIEASGFDLPSGLVSPGQSAWLLAAKQAGAWPASLLLVLPQSLRVTPDHHLVAQIYLSQAAAQTASLIERKTYAQNAELADKSRQHSVKRSQSLAKALPRSLEQSIVGSSPQIEAVRQAIVKFAPSDQNLLVTGETGTGKELVARALHSLSARADGPFIAENVAAISANLLESELFGHVKGAFTGADKDKKGLVERADGGTLFLDEIGDLPPELQVRLLRVLQEREIRPVGSDTPRKVDFRLVTATHRDLPLMASQETFRADLLYRLKPLSIALPPLRERQGDVAVLFSHFLSAIARRADQPRLVASDQSLALLEAHSYPGNVRELENLAQRLSFEPSPLEAETVQGVLSELQIPASAPARATDPGLAQVAGRDAEQIVFQPSLSGQSGLEALSADLKTTLSLYEAELINDALRKTGGHRGKAAELLGVPKRTLNDKINRLDLD